MRTSLFILLSLTGPLLADPPKPVPVPTGAEKDKLLKARGGNVEVEAAVARGVAWISRQQKEDGHWEFDGSSKDHVAATGMALMPFLGAGVGPDHEKYGKVVKSGLDWLVAKVDKEGSFGTKNMYAHAIGTIALCDAVRLSKDEKLRTAAAKAVEFLVKAQDKGGSWGYTPNTAGDTSIVGWQIQALESARLAGIEFDRDKVFKPADKFLESLSKDKGAKYGYREPGESMTLTPVGLLSRYFMGTMTVRDPAMGRGVDFLKQYPPQKGYFDMYYYFYATRLFHFYDGPDWHKFWNPKMRDMLIDLQKKAGEDDVRGSWDKDQGFIGQCCGKLGTTALAVLTLEVYYRDVPQKAAETPEK